MKIAQHGCNIAPTAFASQDLPPIIALDSPLSPASHPYEVLIWTNIEPFGGEQLQQFPHLKLFISWGTDNANFDEDFLQDKGIIVKKVDSYCTETLSEYVTSLLLLFERQHYELIKGEKVTGRELYRKKVGVVGLGKIGFKTANMLRRAFACDIYYYSRSDKQLPNYTYLPLRELFKTCDYVLVAAKSRGFTIARSELDQVNPDLVIVNIARDTILPLRTLLPLLEKQRIRGFVGDLKIPNLPALPPNVLLTPQRGYLTDASLQLKQTTLLFYLQKFAQKEHHVYIVRHGQTEWNTQERLQGSMDSPLTSVGRAHARAIADSLTDKHIEVVLTSPLGRARKTAAIIGKKLGVPVVQVPEFTEIHGGIFEGKSKPALEELFPEFFAARKHNAYCKLFVPYPAGESYFDVYLRVLEPLLAQFTARRSMVIVGHESVNRILRGVVTEQAFEDMVQHRQKNNEIIHYELATDVESSTVVEA